MKKIFNIAILLYALNIQAQASKVKLGVQYNADFWKPYTANVPKELKSKIHSNTISLNLELAVLEKSKITWYTGISYKHINYKAKDRISKFFYQYQTGNAGVVTTHDVYYTYKDPADLVSKSNSLGIINEVDYLVLKRTKTTGRVGIQAEVYLYENYKSEYRSSDNVQGTYGDQVTPWVLVPSLSRKFFLSGLSTAIFYRLAFAEDQDVNFGAKISLGTNVYSDWDQFSRCAWLGLGFEIGFGNVKLKERKVD